MPDSAYNAETDLARRQYEHGVSVLNDQERNTKFEYGIDDPTNPNSRMAALKRTFLQRGKAASAGLASRGQLYSGLHESTLASNRRNQEFAGADLRRSYEQQLAAFRDQRQQLAFAREGAGHTAMQNWLARQVPVEPDVDDPGPVPAPGKAAPTPQQRARQSNRNARTSSNRAVARARARARRRRR